MSLDGVLGGPLDRQAHLNSVKTLGITRRFPVTSEERARGVLAGLPGATTVHLYPHRGHLVHGEGQNSVTEVTLLYIGPEYTGNCIQQKTNITFLTPIT